MRRFGLGLSGFASTEENYECDGRRPVAGSSVPSHWRSFAIGIHGRPVCGAYRSLGRRFCRMGFSVVDSYALAVRAVVITVITVINESATPPRGNAVRGSRAMQIE